MTTKSKKTKAVKAVTELTVLELREAAATQQAIIDSAKEQMDLVQQELRTRFNAKLSEHLQSMEKQHGQLTFEVDGVKLVGEITARREWDSEKLEKIARTLPYDVVQRTFAIKFSVPEKAFNAVRDEKLLDQLIDARTVKYSDPKFTFAS